MKGGGICVVSDSLSRADIGRVISINNKHFELGIRSFGEWLRAPRLETFATALDENPDLWCEVT